MPKEKHLFVENDIIARNDLKEIKKMEEPKTLKNFENIDRVDLIVNQRCGELDWFSKGILENYNAMLRQLAIAHIKYMRREGRDLYYYSIDEKSAIPKLMKIFNLNETDLK